MLTYNYKQTFAIELDSVIGVYEFNMLTCGMDIDRQEIVDYFCLTHGYTPQYVSEHMTSLFRVVKEFIPLET